jgi:hypothetical protein
LNRTTEKWSRVTPQKVFNLSLVDRIEERRLAFVAMSEAEAWGLHDRVELED